MADVKISALPAATTPVAGTEVLPIVQSGTTKKLTIADVTAGRAMSASSLTLSSPLGVASGGTGLTSLTAGRIPYGDGTNAFGNSANLFWDATNSRLGIGTSSPNVSLQVAGVIRAGADNTSGIVNLGDATGATTNVGIFRGSANATSGGNWLNLGGYDGISFAVGNAALGSQTRAMTLDANGTFRVKGAGTAGSTDAFLVDGSAPGSAARIDSSGRLLVGTTSEDDDSRLGVYRTGNGATASFFGSSSGGSVLMRVATGQTSANAIFFYTSYTYGGSGTVAGSISINGSSTTYGNSSDYRLKKNIQPINNSLSRVLSMRPVQFDWIADNKTSEGFLAHELAEVFPYAVAGNKDQVDDKGEIVVQNVDYGRITPLLTSAIQELAAKVTALEEQLNG